MGTWEADVEAYWTECKGHVDKGELKDALIQLGKAGGEVAAAAVVISTLVGAGFVAIAIGGAFGVALNAPVAVAIRNIFEHWVMLDTEEREAAVKVAAWMREHGIAAF